MIIVVAMIPLLVTMFILTLHQISTNAGQQSTQMVLSDNAQLAMDTIEQDIKISTAFNQTVVAPFSDSYGPNNSGDAWSFGGTSAQSRTLILSGIATTSNSSTSSRTPVYVAGGIYDCSAAQMAYNAMLTYRIIYFVREQTLYRRVLTDNTGPSLCNGPYSQKQSCPGELSGGWNAVCAARDEIVARSVTTFSVTYYTQQQSTSLSTIYADMNPDDMAQADDAEITLNLTRKSGGIDVTTNQKLRVARLNEI